MSVRLTKGTKQYVNAVVKDGAGVVTDLNASGASAIKFDIVRISDQAAIVTNQAATATGMIIQCLVDTTGYNVEPHAIYPKFTLGSEVVVLGPYTLYIIE